MATKAVIQRQKTAANLRACLQSHGAEAASELERALEAETTPEVEVPDMEDFQILLRRRLETARRRLVLADEAHLRDLRRLKALRVSRDRAVGELRRLIARLRAAVDGVCGPGSAAEALLLEGLTPRDPVVLQRVVVRSVQHLEERGLPRPQGSLGAIDLAPELWVDLLREPLDRLAEALTNLTLEKRAAVDSLLAKNAAKKDYDRLYASTTRMLQEFFRYVGMDEMAGSIRPRRRKTSSVEEVPEADEALDGAAQDFSEEAPDIAREKDLQPIHRHGLALVPLARAPDEASEPLPSQ